MWILEYIPSQTSFDDEETIEDDEKQNSNELERKNEIDMLKKESKLSIDDVLDQLPKGYLETRAKELEEKVKLNLNKCFKQS